MVTSTHSCSALRSIHNFMAQVRRYRISDVPFSSGRKSNSENNHLTTDFKITNSVVHVR